MQGDDEPLDNLRREVQELAEKLWHLQEELRTIREMIEDRQQH